MPLTKSRSVHDFGWTEPGSPEVRFFRPVPTVGWWQICAVGFGNAAPLLREPLRTKFEADELAKLLDSVYLKGREDMRAKLQPSNG